MKAERHGTDVVITASLLEARDLVLALEARHDSFADTPVQATNYVARQQRAREAFDMAQAIDIARQS